MAHITQTFTSPYGYRIVRTSDGRQLSEHRYIWEQAHGPIPPGIEIHHKNGRKTDNRLSNLEAVESLAHKKLHAGIRINDAGELVKRCSSCSQVKPVEGGYYRHPRADDGYVYPRCRKCHVAAVVRSEQRAKAGTTRPRFKKWRDWMETPETAREVIAGADLSDRQRAVLTGLVVERKKMREVASEIGVSEGIVSRHLGRAIDRVDASEA
ncbi:HNH endonuclease [Roseovarius sp.]|uniref:HNH endonuclease n=1 Tax=Roseovarius sp. TaxID=1486281 RepID=UPI003B59863C